MATLRNRNDILLQATSPRVDTIALPSTTTVDWNVLTDGSGTQPDDNATVGATWDVDINGQPTSIIQTFYQSAAPSSGMVAGDFWIDSDDNKVYRYNGSSWLDVQDDDIASAITDAADAQATADGKVVTFAQVSAPSATSIGDLWMDTDDGNKMYRATATGTGSWVALQDLDIATALSDASNAQSTADGKIVSFYQTTAPTATSIGDIWVDTDDDNKTYRASAVGSGSWVSIQDGTITTAQSDATTAIGNAATAQSTADGKVVTFVQTTAPTSEGIGDLWMDTDDDNKMYRSTVAASSVNWVAYAQESADWTKIFGAAKADDNATVGGSMGEYTYVETTRPITWASNSDVTATATTVERTTGTGAWDAGAYGSGGTGNPYDRAILQFKAATTDKEMAMGWSDVASTDHTRDSIDHCFYLKLDGTYDIYESGVSQSVTGDYITSTVFKIIINPYGWMEYYVDNEIVQKTDITIATDYSVDSSIYTLNGKFDTISIDELVTTEVASPNVTGKIDQYNVGTYIRNAAIQNAQIGALSVGTLKIQDNAVTVPVATEASAKFNVGVGSWTTVQSATITLTASSDVFITAGVWILSQVAVSNELFRLSSGQVRLLRDTTTVKSHAFAYNWSQLQSVTFKESLSSGTYTYHLQQYNNYANTGLIADAGDAYDRYVSILGVAK